MKKFLCIAIITTMVMSLLVGFCVTKTVRAVITLTVDDDRIECPGANFTTIQAAINAASDGDTIDVYPGIYDPVVDVTPPTWGGHYYAQGIVVWKANLTIEAVDPDPAKTVIDNNLGAWMDWWRIQHLTGGVWTGSGSNQTGGFNPGTSASPNAIMIVKPGVTIKGFTIHAHCYTPSGGYNGSGVLIGGVAPGDTHSLGADNNIVENCVFSDVWQAVYIWHSSGNKIINNTVAALGSTDHWAGISIYDGYSEDQINLNYLSQNNLIAHNTLANRGIAVGAWAPSIWTTNAGTLICCNNCTQVGVSYSHGPVTICGNTGEFWQYNTDKVLHVTGISYTGDTLSPGTIALSAQINNDGSANDISGFSVSFGINGTSYTAITDSAGVATVPNSVTLTPGIYLVEVSTNICPCCTFTDSQYLAVYGYTDSFVTGGGWIWSPLGAYTEDPTLEGKATFGFVSKYQKGANIPTGNTEFQFKAGNLNFKSTSYDWLVIAGNKAKFKGTGTINGTGSYKFMLTAIDGDYNKGTDPDEFHIKIWGDSGVIYDNMSSLSDDDFGGTELGGGSIVIHKS
jgi:parallel beta-helix repeat protein